MVRVRFAPSPTGIPHIGSSRTALFNFLLARNTKGEFILRIEDTDRARLVKGAKESILEMLSWLGLSFDKMYVQSERLTIYQQYAQKLVDLGFAIKDEGAVRFIAPQDKTLEWIDAVGNKKISFQSQSVDDFIILKSDGYPTYHLASVVDDSLMKISHVIRGEEWISSTPKHLLLYEAFKITPPIFVHLPSIVGENKKKLSKRDGAKSVFDYKKEGFLKEALLNFLVLLGWNPGGDKEIMDMEEMIKLFDLKDLNTSSAVFDQKKLEWLNGEYIRSFDAKKLLSRCLDQGVVLDNLSFDQKEKIINVAKDRINKLSDLNRLIGVFFIHPAFLLDEKQKSQKLKLENLLENLDIWNADNILVLLKKFLSEEKIKMSVVYKILTGEKSGLPLPPLLEILGKQIIIKHLKSIN